jgi:outer membrane protein insertion porin family
MVPLPRVAGSRPRRLAASVLGAITLLGLAAARPAAAQVPPGATDAGLTITAVRLQEGGQEVTDPGLLGLVDTRVGQPLDLLQVRDSIAHLFGIGRFQDIHVNATREAAGVALLYDLVPLRRVTRVEFEGTLGLSAGRLRRAVEERFNGPPPAGRAEAAAQVLQDLYRSYGYLRASVSPSVHPDSPTSATMVFAVDAGPRARLGGITVTGHAGLDERSLLQRLDLRVGGEYDQAALERKLQGYVADLRSRGYYEASASHDVTAAPDATTLHLDLNVESGPLVTVSFEGDALPPDRQKDLAPIEREGSVDVDLLEDSDRRIETYLRDQGYWKARATHRLTSVDDRLNVVFTVTRGPLGRVADVELTGNQSAPESTLRPLIRLERGEPFVASTLGADVAAIERYYRGLGFAGVSVQPTTVEQPGSSPSTSLITVRLAIDEGPRTLVRQVEIDGNRAIPDDRLRAILQSRAGQPYSDRHVLEDVDVLTEYYLDRGYQAVSVVPDRTFNADRTEVDLAFTVNEGPQSIIDHVIVVGNTRTRTSTILAELPLRPGDPLGLADLLESRRRLEALGLFRRVSVAPLEHGAGARPDLLVTVEEAPATTIGYGGGLEGGRRLRPSPEGGPAQERFEFAPRGFFEIGRRNLWGKNRSINFFTRLSARASDNADASQTSHGFNEYRVLLSYREPRPFGSAGDFLLNGVIEQAVRTSFDFNRKALFADYTRQLTPIYRLSGRYSFGYTKRFNERLSPEDEALIDRVYPKVRLGSVSTTLLRDTRDDAIDPGKGAWISLDGELAARGLGSEVGFVKSNLQAFFYRRVSERQRVILAFGGRLGLATGFPQAVPATDANGQVILGPNGQPIEVIVKDLPESERFFAGGDTTVRGFALDQLGTPATIDQNGFPRGGNGLVVMNVELRLPVWRALGAVAFVDAGNVFAYTRYIDLARIRGSVGFGIRYRSPIGPLRIDLGFKLDRRVDVTGQLEPLTALHISFGQAF